MRLWHRTGLLLALPLLLAVCVAPGRAQAWWNGDWSYRMKLTADTTDKGAKVSDPIGRTQILVRLHSGNFNFATAKEDGTDLRFVAGDDRTPLKFHIERFDGLIDQVGLFWVDVTDLAPNAVTPLYIYWGNKNAANASDSRATYDPDQVLVYHFGEENGLPRDATGYANNALTAAKRDTAGMIGYGALLDGKSPIQIPVSPSLTLSAGQAGTWSMWIRPDPSSRTAVLYQHKDGPSAFTIGLDQGVAYAEIGTPDGVKRTSPGTPIAGEGWHHVAVEASGDRLAVFLDGKPAGEVAAALPALGGQITLGGTIAPPAPPPDATAGAPGGPAATPPAASTPGSASPAPGAPAPQPPPPAPPAPPPNFAGGIDEVQIAKVARPLGAIEVAVANQGPDPKLLTFDVAEEASVFGTGYVGVILRSVTPDAWVVIGILGLMALISWWVMVRKAVYLNRLNGANDRFRAIYRKAMLEAGRDGRAGFKGIPETRAIRGSPLYRLYEVGARELNDRLDGGLLEPNGTIAPQSIAAIRAAVDARLIRENQRLNRLMVLLTIAISGGPFLGLLGTVVGVMITFAAIAQAGDVTVNAIAPGISAALLATVAGLAVAIPALFGYNYLLTRIRDASADMGSFVEELVTRIGEGFRTPRVQAGE